MEKGWISCLLLLSLCLAACREDFPEAELPGATGITAGANEDYYEGQLNIKLNPEAAAELHEIIRTRGNRLTPALATRTTAALLPVVGEATVKPLFRVGGKFAARQKAAGLDRWFRLRFSKEIDAGEAAGILTRSGKPGGIEYIERVARLHIGEHRCLPEKVYGLIYPQRTPGFTVAAKPFNDPGLDKQWNLGRGTVTTVPEAGMGMFAAWTKTTGNPEVIVAVLDMGVDYNHEDLRANMWVNPGETAGNNWDNDGNGWRNDVHGYNFIMDWGELEPGNHGTHIAGTIAAVNNNGKGICGIAGGDGSGNGVRIMSCQTGGLNGGIGGVEEAFQYAADNGAVICSCSWFQGNAMQSVREAIRYFIQHAGTDQAGNKNGPMKGGLVVFAAANNQNNYKVYPPAYEEVLAVAATNTLNQRAYYSNYGDWVDIAAPGGSGTSSDVEENMILSTLPADDYGYMQGTSMACPHVAGVAALIVSAHADEPDFTCGRLKEILLSSGTELSTMGSDTTLNRVKMLRADLALGVKENIIPAPVREVRWSNREKLRVHWKAQPDAHGQMPCRYVVYAGKAPLKLTHPLAQPGISAAANEEISCVINPFTEKGNYEVRVFARNLYGKLSPTDGKAQLQWDNDYTAPRAVTAAEVTAGAGQYVISWKQVTDDGDGVAAAYRICAKTDGNIIADTVVWTGKQPAGTLITVRMDLPAGVGGEPGFTIAARDEWYNYSAESPLFAVGARLPEDTPALAGFSVYPNPVKDSLTLAWPGYIRGQLHIRAYDVAARLLLSKVVDAKNANPCRIGFSSFAPGGYTLKIKGEGIAKVFTIRKL